MGEAAMLERHRTLIRFEHAAGAAFGHHEEPAAEPLRQFTVPAVAALAACAAVLAAALGYLA